LDSTWKKCLADAWQKEWDDMNRDDIIRMARESGLQTDTSGVWVDDGYIENQLTRFAALVRADEREAILQMSAAEWFETQADYDAAIRARGQA
jgi:hypothetical protein